MISSAGGLHKFIQHKTPIMTDSGGFQVRTTHGAHLRAIAPAMRAYLWGWQVMSMASRDQFIYSHQLPEEKEEEEAARCVSCVSCACGACVVWCP